jgi:hypothetical protein
MSESKPNPGIVLIEGFADREYGPVGAAANGRFGARSVFLTPEARPVASIAGLGTQRTLAPADSGDLAGVAVIGSDHWSSRAG